MSSSLKRVLSLCLVLVMVLSIVIPQASALSYSGSSSYKSGKYYTRLTNVELTGNQRVDIVNVAKSQVGYQEGSSSSKLSGEVKGSGNYTEYGRWYGMQDMWCAMFVSWCANAAGISTSIVPSHSYTPTGLNWFRNRGQAYTRATVANGGYTPQAGDIIYFKSKRNSNITNHIGIVTGYSNGTVYTIEGNTSSATISTNGGAVCEKAYSISNTYIVYICKPAYKNTATTTTTTTTTTNTNTSTTGWLTGTAKEVMFDAEYYGTKYPSLKAQYGSDADKLFDYFMDYGLKEGHAASPIFDVKYYVENNADVKSAYGTDYVAAAKHFVSTGINEARVMAQPLDLGQSFQARIGFPSAGLNFSLNDTNVITYEPSDAAAQIWTFERHPAGCYRIINSKNGYSLAVAGYEPESDVSIAEYKDSRRQLWYIYEAADGRYVFRSMAASDCVLDVYGGLTASQTDVWTYTYNGTDAQMFTIDKLNNGLDSLTPVDLGTNFYAKINASEGMNLSLNDTNVILYGDSGADAQVWKFVRQTDGSYEIINQKNSLLLDVYWATEISGANVQIFQDHDNIAQRWFIYSLDGEYVFRPACSDTCVLNVQGNGTADLTNIETYAFNGSDAQKFQLTMVERDNILAYNVDVGNDFYARIMSSDGMNLSLSGDNVIIYSESTAPAQIWKFSLQADGSYKIVNQKTGTLMDVYWAKDESGTNVQVYRDNESNANKWFIHRSGDEYVFRPACSQTRVLEVEGNGTADMTNVQINDFADSDAQKFTIVKVDDYVDLGTPVDLGTGFYAKINASEGMNLSLCDDNVIIYGDSSAAAQVWKFERQTNGSYKIINQKNGKLLDVYWASDVSGTNVQIYPDNTSDANKWYIYQSANGYIFRPACSNSRVLDVYGNGTAAMTNVQIYDYNGSDAQLFNILVQDGYTPGASTTNNNMVVLRKIMYAVETGGQVYGKCDYADFTEAYTNTSQEHAITIGAGQWYGPEAKTLLNLIRETDYATFSALDTAGIEEDLDNASWSTYKLSKTSAKAKCIQKIISSDVGIRCQDQLMDEQLIKYMKEAADLGVTEESAQMMCANIRHLGGLAAVKRILNKTDKPYTIHSIYEAMQSDTGNQVGTFRSRNKMVYNSLLEYLE